MVDSQPSIWKVSLEGEDVLREEYLGEIRNECPESRMCPFADARFTSS